tara:strand:- start:77 stop:379 length:303 start_codon:yes stop_codon:yes gene_type:complete
MVNRNKILSDLSKFAVDAMSTFSGLKEEIETIVSLRVNKIIKKMNLVKKDEFDVLKKVVDDLVSRKASIRKNKKKTTAIKKKSSKKPKTKAKSIKKRKKP